MSKKLWNKSIIYYIIWYKIAIKIIIVKDLLLSILDNLIYFFYIYPYLYKCIKNTACWFNILIELDNVDYHINLFLNFSHFVSLFSLSLSHNGFYFV